MFCGFVGRFVHVVSIFGVQGRHDDGTAWA